ncbi:phycoerythrobilin:ferredoxin oxidoreductase [Gloeocapsa sp. PCC 73106]|uniref:phycoerythrobilin:ferredoxin oxidoreductase n=1 Tax=Gloeocapsa sp. PCC 73106 TaxID=102232 RepID=UPI0002AC4C9A|nr:phycoerythrobilin:ferredoxin oxidoreductase [Gloeocapsa sp. PCC 73106]ELR97454.1 phycoerythrobilin:ferredoxin oxidoreductase [Gloeocapsa sp. PCC 73106]
MTLYQPFLDYAINLMQEQLSLEPYPIPEGFEQKQGTMGKGIKETTVLTTSYAYKCPKLRQIRAAHVEGGNSLQVLNFVIFPELNYDLPFFGADLVTLPGGHLIALDLQPLFHDELYQQKYYQGSLLSIFTNLSEQLPWGGDFPDEAKSFFSPVFLWTRPQQTEIVETLVLEAFKQYLQTYLSYVEQAQIVSDRQKQLEILAAQKRYVNYRATKDPARGMFTRLYGEEWTEEYIHGFLFDLERQLLVFP